MPKISIIVTVYDTSNYLKRCLDSLVNQTLKNIEIVIVNDGSRDKSQEIIDEYTFKYGNVKSFVKTTGGLFDARNYGIEKSCGDYIGFIDSTDYADITMFEKLYEKIITENGDIAECDFYLMNKNNKTADTATYYENTDSILRSIRLVVCNKLFKSDVIRKNAIFFPKGLQYGDVEFIYKTILHTNKIVYVDEELLFSVQNDKFLYNNQFDKIRDIFSILDNLELYYKENELYEQKKVLLEYLNVKLLMDRFFLRIFEIDDSKLRRDLSEEVWQYLSVKYPKWHKNKYLKISSNVKYKLFRFMNKTIFKLNCYLLRSAKH